MKKWSWVLVIIGVEFVLVAITLLYQYSGLKYYIKATSYINGLSFVDKKAVSADFYAVDPNYYSGILAGTWGQKIWIWGNAGLRYFTVDKNSVYSYYDGCTVASLQSKEAGFVARDISSDFASWNAKAGQGDYVTVRIAGAGNGWVPGNLREIWTYNFWLFMRKDMRTECVK